MRTRARWVFALLLAALAVAGCTNGPRGPRDENRFDDPFPRPPGTSDPWISGDSGR